MSADDGVCEIHGVSDGTRWARVREIRDHPHVSLTCSNSTGTTLTAAEARYLGRKILRLARRIEQRNAS